MSKFDEQGNYIDPVYGLQADGKAILFDAHYGRDGTITVVFKAVCGGCKEVRKCLRVDQSEAEYNPGIVCLDCIENLFAATQS